MDLKAFHYFVEELKLPAFREKQIRQALFVSLYSGWNEVTVLPKDLRAKMAEELPWSSVTLENEVKNNKDNSVKAVLRLADGELIESVLIRHKDGPSTGSGRSRNTVCVSSQVGCPMGCSFCATGKAGFKRNLEAEEIIDQVLYFARLLKKQGGKVTNIVYMGMGEPFLNYDEVMESIRILNDSEGFNLGSRHFSISTCGIVPGIKRLAKEKYQVNLALSMHAPTDKLRGQFMPVNRQYGLDDVLSAIDLYIKETNRRVMIEYLLIDGVNDREEDAVKLAEILKERPLCYANLIPYNDTGNPGYKSSKENMDRFSAILNSKRARFTIRHSFGDSMDSACGQLAGQKK